MLELGPAAAVTCATAVDMGNSFAHGRPATHLTQEVPKYAPQDQPGYLHLILPPPQ